jgi:hypothetical protein
LKFWLGFEKISFKKDSFLKIIFKKESFESKRIT